MTTTVTRPHTLRGLQERRSARKAQRRVDERLRRELASYRTESELMELQDIVRRAPEATADALLDLVSR